MKEGSGREPEGKGHGDVRDERVRQRVSSFLARLHELPEPTPVPKSAQWFRGIVVTLFLIGGRIESVTPEQISA
jgi:hypothetical protein